MSHQGAKRVIVWLLLAGCACQPPSSSAVEEESAVSGKPPLMFNEASLPAGFPPPGPVGEVLVKHYPAYRAAFTESMAGNEKARQNRAFSILFKHIKANNIAMTAPVEMTYEPAQSESDQPEAVAMAFLYADELTGPAGNFGAVEVRDMPAATYLSITVRGSYNASTLSEALSQLRQYAAAQNPPLTIVGKPRLLGYNSPFVPWFLRIGEVQLPVQTSTMP